MRFVRPVSVFLVLNLLVLLAGCGGSKPVAEVNGEEISQDLFDSRLAQVQQMYEENYGLKFDDEEGQELLAALKNEVVQQLINEELLLQEAKKEKIDVSKQEVDNRIKQDKELLGGDKEFADYLKERLRISEKEYRELWRTQLIISKLADKVTAKIKVTPEEVAQYYEDNKEMFVTPEQVKASHILLKTEKEAQEVIEELKKGADFAELAVAKSTDPSAKQNKGDLGYFDQNANLVEEFKTAAFALKTGELTPKPVQTEFGYHVIKVTDRKPETQQTFAEVKDQIEAYLLQNRKSDAFVKYLEELKEKATIKNYLETDSPDKKGSTDEDNPDDDKKAGSNGDGTDQNTGTGK